MTKCPVCQKPKSEYEMRPLIDVKEIKVSDKLTEESSEREVGGAKLQMVCRACWAHVISGMSKEDVVEMMETLAGLLLELDRRNKIAEMPKVGAPLGLPTAEEWVEKMRQQPAVWPQKYGGYQPQRIIGAGDGTFDPGMGEITFSSTTMENTSSQEFFNVGDTKINWNKFKDLGDEWLMLVPSGK